MKTITTLMFLLAFLAFAACSKKSSTNNDDSKYPDNIASTWSRTIGTHTQISDTFTIAGANERWQKDMVILTPSEASQLQGLIQAIPKQTRDAFASKLDKYKNVPPSPHSFRSNIYPTTPEYDELYKFCVNNVNETLPLALGYLFNDTEETFSELGSMAVNICIQNKFQDLKLILNDELQSRKYTEDGLYRVSYSAVSIQRRLAKKILNQ